MTFLDVQLTNKSSQKIPILSRTPKGFSRQCLNTNTYSSYLLYIQDTAVKSNVERLRLHHFRGICPPRGVWQTTL